MTPASLWRIERTGVESSTTVGPSCSAIRSEISCEPPTIRSCWAPPSVSVRISSEPAERM